MRFSPRDSPFVFGQERSMSKCLASVLTPYGALEQKKEAVLPESGFSGAPLCRTYYVIQ